MVKRDNPQKSNQAAAKALELAKSNPAISDFRKESLTYQFLAAGRNPEEESEEFIKCLHQDFGFGFLDGRQVAVHLACVQTDTQRKMMELKASIFERRRRLPVYLNEEAP